MCVKCDVEQPIEKFAKVDGKWRQRTCNKCRSKKMKRSPEAQRRHTLKSRYGLTLEAWQALSDAQGGLCANPGCDSPHAVVDHDHETGRVRGLLCHACNRCEGLLGNSPERIAGLAEYLRSSS